MSSKILIAEDQADLQAILKALLGSAGYAIVTALDGVEALEKVASEHPDLILLDMAMPRKTGWEVAQELRDKGEKTPIIALTARAMSEDAEKACTVGCDLYMAKPFDSRVLLSEIERLLKAA